jgi:hypothetical protein
MFTKRNIYRLLLILIIGLFVLLQVIDLINPDLFHSIKIVSNIASVISIAAIGFLYFLVKEFDKKADEYTINQKKMKNIFDTLDVAIWSHDLKSDTLLITPGIEKLYG